MGFALRFVMEHVSPVVANFLSRERDTQVHNRISTVGPLPLLASPLHFASIKSHPILDSQSSTAQRLLLRPQLRYLPPRELVVEKEERSSRLIPPIGTKAAHWSFATTASNQIEIFLSLLLMLQPSFTFDFVCCNGRFPFPSLLEDPSAGVGIREGRTGGDSP